MILECYPGKGFKIVSFCLFTTPIDHVRHNTLTFLSLGK